MKKLLAQISLQFKLHHSKSFKSILNLLKHVIKFIPYFKVIQLTSRNGYFVIMVGWINNLPHKMKNNLSKNAFIQPK